MFYLADLLTIVWTMSRQCWSQDISLHQDHFQRALMLILARYDDYMQVDMHSPLNQEITF